MAITIRAAGGFAETIDQSDTYPLPASVATDDLLGIVLGTRLTGSVATSNWTPDSGYVEIAYVEDTVTAQTEPHLLIYRKFHDGSEVDPTVTSTADTNVMVGAMFALTGVDQTTPEDATAVDSINSGAAAEFTPTGIDTVTNGAWVLSVVAGIGLTNFALKAGSEQGFTLLFGGGDYDSSIGQDMGIGVAYKEIATATTVTCPTWTCTSSEWIATTLAFRPAGGVTNLAGTLFQKAPTFPTGAISATYALAGSLFVKAPTFPTGAVTATYALTGTLFTKAPTFPQGAVSQAAGPQTLDGVLFQKAPTFPQGAVTSTYALAGVLFQKAPTFPQGAVAATYALTGVLFQKAPTFPTGTVSATYALVGVLFQKAPTFPTGTVSSTYALTGVLYQNTPTFPQGAISQVGGAQNLAGVLFTKAPTFATGLLWASQRQKPNATTSNDGWDTAPLAGQAIHTYIATDDSDYITVTV